jgi:hypothetical protein
MPLFSVWFDGDTLKFLRFHVYNPTIILLVQEWTQSEITTIKEILIKLMTKILVLIPIMKYSLNYEMTCTNYDEKKEKRRDKTK